MSRKSREGDGQIQAGGELFSLIWNRHMPFFDRMKIEI